MDGRSSQGEPDAASTPSAAHSLVEHSRDSWAASFYDQTKVVNVSKEINIRNQNNDM